jgi:hypothetical protein
MQEQWIKPDFTTINVNGECTAYSGTAAAPGRQDQLAGEQADTEAAAGGQSLAPCDQIPDRGLPHEDSTPGNRRRRRFPAVEL